MIVTELILVCEYFEFFVCDAIVIELDLVREYYLFI